MLEKKADPISDKGRVSLTLKQRPIFMLLQCDASDAQPLSITVGKEGAYLGGPPILRSTIIRFDKQPASTQMWGYTGYFAVSQGDARGIIAKIASAKTLALRLQDRQGTPIDLVFDLAGAAAQVANFKKACESMGMSL